MLVDVGWLVWLMLVDVGFNPDHHPTALRRVPLSHPAAARAAEHRFRRAAE